MTPRAPAWAAAWLIAGLAAACGDDAPPPGEVGCPADRVPERGISLEAGTGEAEFVPIEDGETLPLVRGGQGGWHIWLGFRGPALDSADRVCFDYDIERVDGTVVHRAPPYAPTLEPSGEMFGWPAVIPRPACHVDTEATLIVFASDRNGAWGEDEKRIVIGAGDDPPTGDCPLDQ